MSVKKNDRHVSCLEYENTFTKIYNLLIIKIKKIPIRYNIHLSIPFQNILNEIYKDIMELSNLYLHSPKWGIDRYRMCNKILSEFEKLISVIYAYWNLSCKKNGIKYQNYKKRQNVADYVNKEIALIEGIMNKCNKDENIKPKIPHIKAFDNKSIGDVVFLKNLKNLQGIIYKCAVRSSKKIRDAQLEVLVELSMDAFYYAKTGNDILISDEKTYKSRNKNICKALDTLYSMNRPVRELAYADGLSEKELETICKLISETIKILNKIKISESEKYGSNY